MPGCCDCAQHDMDGFRPMLIKQVLNKIDCINVCKHLFVRNVHQAGVIVPLISSRVEYENGILSSGLCDEHSRRFTAE